MHVDATDLKDTISLLVGERKEHIVHERAIRLFQFQTWMYTPDNSLQTVKIAGRLASTLLLAQIANRTLNASKKPMLYDSAQVQRLFKRAEYRNLYDFVIGDYGGWTELAWSPSPQQLDRNMKSYRRTALTTARLLEYQFRYMEHNGSKKEHANLSHALFFLKKQENSSAHKTLKNHWSDHQHSAVFLYASELLGFNFWPATMMDETFVSQLLSAAEDTVRTRRFFETSAYIAMKTAGLHDAFAAQEALMSWPNRKRPKTTPLTEAEEKRMEKYDSEYMDMRDDIKRGEKQ
jgi:hypothetical protein